MSEYNITLPSKPKIVREEGTLGVYEIDGLYPGYGHTLGNSLRRIILSSLTGAAITQIKIAGVSSHEFSTIAGVKEDVIAIILNLKKVRVKMITEEPQTLTIKAKGVKDITAKDIEIPGQVEIVTLDQHIASITDKATALDIEIRVERGVGFVSKDVYQKERADIGAIALDAVFAPIKRVNYEVENMRIGDRTDFNRLRITIETDGTIAPHEALGEINRDDDSSAQSNCRFQRGRSYRFERRMISPKKEGKEKKELDTEFLKTRIETLGLSTRTTTALTTPNIRTVGGLARKEDDLENIEGFGPKTIQEIKKVLGEFGMTLK